MDIITILKKYPLCHRCFGRLYAKLLHTSNYERGKSLKIAKAIELESKLLNLMEKYNELTESGNPDEIEKTDTEKLKIASEITEIKGQLKYIYKSGLTEIKLVDIPEEINEEEGENN